MHAVTKASLAYVVTQVHFIFHIQRTSDFSKYRPDFHSHPLKFSLVWIMSLILSISTTVSWMSWMTVMRGAKLISCWLGGIGRTVYISQNISWLICAEKSFPSTPTSNVFCPRIVPLWGSDRSVWRLGQGSKVQRWNRIFLVFVIHHKYPHTFVIHHKCLHAQSHLIEFLAIWSNKTSIILIEWFVLAERHC